jgi:hypothetical protein
MNNDTKFMDETRYAMFLNDILHTSMIMCSTQLDYSAMKVLSARGDKFLIETAVKRAVKQ